MSIKSFFTNLSQVVFGLPCGFLTGRSASFSALRAGVLSSSRCM